MTLAPPVLALLARQELRVRLVPVESAGLLRQVRLVARTEFSPRCRRGMNRRLARMECHLFFESSRHSEDEDE